MKEVSYGICPYRLRYNKIDILVIKAQGRNDWGFIKGKPENNESIAETSIRECFEETGIIINKEILEEYFFNEYKRKNIGIFLVDSSNIDVTSFKLAYGEVAGIQWHTIDMDIDFQPNQQALYDTIIEFLNKKPLEGI